VNVEQEVRLPALLES